MTGLRGTTRGEPNQGYDAEAAEWRAKLPAPERAGSLIKLGMRLLDDGRHAEAEAPLGECLEIRQEAQAEGHWLIFNTMSVLGERPVDARPGRVRTPRWRSRLGLKNSARLSRCCSMGTKG